jgi:DNA polymerase III gamma/tau subunit
LRFNPLQRETIALFLQEKISLDNRSSYLISLSSGGSIGRALAMKDDSYLTMRKVVLGMISKIKVKSSFELLSFVHDFGQERKEIIDSIGILMTGYRDALIYKETGEPDRIINQDCIDIIKSLAEDLSGRDILNSIKALNGALYAVNQNANKHLTLEAMIFKLKKYCE